MKPSGGYFTWILVFALAISASILKPNRSQAEQGHFPTEEEAGRLIKTNAPRADMVKLFGDPMTEETISADESMALYLNPGGNSKEALTNSFIGFQIYYTNDAVRLWKPVYGSRYSVQNRDPQKEGAKRMGSLKEGQELEFFVVEENAPQGESGTNLVKLPKLGYIHSIPELRVTELRFATVWPSNQISIALMPKDRLKLRETAKKNIGQRLLIRLNNEELVTPRISSEIDTEEFMISNLGEDQLRRLREALRPASGE